MTLTHEEVIEILKKECNQMFFAKIMKNAT